MYSSILKRKNFIVIIILLTVLNGNSIPAGALGGRRRVRAGDRACLSSGIDTADTQPTKGESIRDNLLDSLTVADKANGFPIPGRMGLRGRKTSGPAKEQIPDHNPAMTNDNKGNTYLVWEHGNELCWAVNKGGDWIGSGKMPGTGGNRPVIVYVPGLQSISAGQEPSAESSGDQGTSTGADQVANQQASGGLFCAWESLTSPKKIMGSTGILTDNGVTWSEPQALTVDDHDDYGLALVMDSNHHPLMLWLQRASLDDDADLYYQVITSDDSPSGSPSDPSVDVNQVVASASTSGNQAAMLAPISGDQASDPAPGAGDQAADSTPDNENQASGGSQEAGVGKETPSAPGNENRGAPPTPADGDPAMPPPSNWVGQASPPPISITGPIAPFLSSSCVVNIIFKSTIDLPSSIPVLGDSVDLEIARFRCFHSPAVEPVGDLAVINEVVASLTLGPHLTVGLDLFVSGQAAINTGTSPAAGTGFPAIQETIFEYGESAPFLYLSVPIPLSVCGKEIGSTRIGISGVVGISYAYIRLPGDPELPREFVTQLNMAIGPQQNVSSLGDKFQGFINVGGGYALSYFLPQSPSRPSFTQAPYFFVAGAVRVGGEWAALAYRYVKSYAPEDVVGKWRDPNAGSYRKSRPWNDPNYLQKAGNSNFLQKLLAMQSMKDKVTKTMTSVMNDGKTLVDEMLEMGKVPLTGTGAVYEGKTVLGDISGDIYNDGVPAVARSESGEIMVVWAKAFEASALGTKIYAATYNGKGWSSPVEVTPEIAFHERPALVFDSLGKPMSVWSSASHDGLDYERSSVEQILQAVEKTNLMYSQRVEGKWTAPKLLATLPGLEEQVDLAAGPNGEIMAVWINQSDKGSLLYSSLWNGTRWTEPALIAKTALAESPAAIYTAQKFFVIWAQDKDGQTETFEDWELYSSIWDGTAWRSQSSSLSEKLTNGNVVNEKKDNQSKFRELRENISAIRRGRYRRRKTKSQ